MTDAPEQSPDKQHPLAVNAGNVRISGVGAALAGTAICDQLGLWEALGLAAEDRGPVIAAVMIVASLSLFLAGSTEWAWSRFSGVLKLPKRGS